MEELYILDASGHLTLTWNPDDAADVARARAEVENLRAAGYSFFAIEGAEGVDELERGKGHLVVRRADQVVQETPAKRRGRPRKAAPMAADVAPAPKTRDGTKQAQVVAMLRRPKGATIAQIVAATEWQVHTVRGFFAGALKKKLGLTVTSEKVEGGERVYRIAD